MAKVEFHFDFGSPNAYLAHQVIPQIQARTGAKFEYVPILLGGVFKLTNNRSPAEKMAGIKNRLEYERLELQRFVRRYDVPFNWNPFFPVNTLLIMRGAVAAQLSGIFERYVSEMFRHMWAEPKDMDDPAVVGAALTESGFDAAAFACAHPGGRGEGPAPEKYRGFGRARHVRVADFLRRRRNLFRQGSAARR